MQIPFSEIFSSVEKIAVKDSLFPSKEKSRMVTVLSPWL